MSLFCHTSVSSPLFELGQVSISHNYVSWSVVVDFWVVIGRSIGLLLSKTYCWIWFLNLFLCTWSSAHVSCLRGRDNGNPSFKKDPHANHSWRPNWVESKYQIFFTMGDNLHLSGKCCLWSISLWVLLPFDHHQFETY